LFYHTTVANLEEEEEEAAAAAAAAESRGYIWAMTSPSLKGGQNENDRTSTNRQLVDRFVPHLGELLLQVPMHGHGPQA